MCQRVSAGRLAPNSQLFTVCTATQFRAIMNEKTRELACAGVSNYEPTRYHGRCHVASYMSSLSSNASPTSVRRRPYGASNDTQRSKANALAPSLRDCSRCALSASIPAVRELISTRRWFHIVTGGWSPWVICERYREKIVSSCDVRARGCAGDRRDRTSPGCEKITCLPSVNSRMQVKRVALAGRSVLGRVSVRK